MQSTSVVSFFLVPVAWVWSAHLHFPEAMAKHSALVAVFHDLACSIAPATPVVASLQLAAFMAVHSASVLAVFQVFTPTPVAVYKSLSLVVAFWHSLVAS